MGSTLAGSQRPSCGRRDRCDWLFMRRWRQFGSSRRGCTYRQFGDRNRCVARLILLRGQRFVCSRRSGRGRWRWRRRSLRFGRRCCVHLFGALLSGCAYRARFWPHRPWLGRPRQDQHARFIFAETQRGYVDGDLTEVRHAVGAAVAERCGAERVDAKSGQTRRSVQALRRRGVGIEERAVRRERRQSCCAVGKKPAYPHCKR